MADKTFGKTINIFYLGHDVEQKNRLQNNENYYNIIKILYYNNFHHFEICLKCLSGHVILNG